MKRILPTGLALFVFALVPVFAFDTVDEQIHHYLDILENGDFDSQLEMLKRLQWSGISDFRLYDPVKHRLNYHAMASPSGYTRQEIDLFAHMIRALGYSGNERYRNTLVNIRDFSQNKKLRGHAKKALIQLDDFERWNRLVAASGLEAADKPVEIRTYLKMLDTDDVMVQRLAARAMFHERRTDLDLLELAAQKLANLYRRQGLDREAQDTVAWLAKAVGLNGASRYGDLLGRVANESPDKSVRNHAKKYAP